MKKTILLLAGLVLAWGVKSQPSAGALRPFENRELPRTQTISYDSEEASLERSREESPYLQPLMDWSGVESRGGDHAVFSNTFKLPFSWVDRQVFLYVGSASNSYEVWVNGRKAGENTSAATAAEFDVTAFAKEGIMNEVEVRVVRGDMGALGKEGNPGGVAAITGETYVVAQPKMRVRDYVASVNFEGADATVQLGVVMKTHLLNARSVRLFYKLLDPQGNEAASGHRDVELAMRGEDTVRFFMTVRDVRPWSHETPDLYTLLLKTQYEGRFPEYVAYTTGLRNVEMTAGKLLVNSYPAPLSVAVYGAHNDRETARKELERIKSEGYNMVKLAGKPQPSWFYSYCDELGLYVCNQADVHTESYGFSRSKGGNPSNDPALKDFYTDRARTMYYTSRNNPSVIMFSIAEKSGNGFNLYESYLALKSVELSRPVIYMDADGEWNSDAVSAQQRAADPAGRIAFDAVRNEAVSAGGGLTLTQGAGDGKYIVRNTSSITTRRGQVVYTVKQGSKKVSSGTLPVEVAPGGEAEVTVPAPQSGKTLKYEVTLE